ncbi:MAG: hypothetical protein J0I31_13750 [Rhizobiales bacterium]|nr:hypothetical protein [Hyphomicrobiales bacterium]
MQLSHELNEFAGYLERNITSSGLNLTAPALAILAPQFRLYAARAAALEAGEHQLAQMEAIATDLDVMVHESLRRAGLPVAAAVTPPAANVIPFPQRHGAGSGDAA